jgi:hypothetical protein
MTHLFHEMQKQAMRDGAMLFLSESGEFLGHSVGQTPDNQGYTCLGNQIYRGLPRKWADMPRVRRIYRQSDVKSKLDEYQ